MGTIYICNHEKNVPSGLSPEWLCSTSCTWAHDVRFVVITGTAHCFHDCIYMCIYIYINIYIERERERDRYKSAYFNINQINHPVWTTLHSVFTYSMFVSELSICLSIYKSNW